MDYTCPLWGTWDSYARVPRHHNMAIDPESFDKPVVDYDFAAVDSPRTLIDQMSAAGGFTATKLAVARDILRGMKNEIDSVDGDVGKVANWLSFPACLCATGTRGFFVEAIKRKMFNVVSTTCGMLDHDIARAYKHYYHGSFELDDIELGEHQLMRLGNVIVPNSSYGEIIEAVVMPVLEDIRNDRLKETGKTGADAWIGFGSVHLVWELGKRIGTPDTLIHWAWKNKVPVCIPGITDGSIGAQLFMFRQKYRDFHIDTLADEQVMSDLTWGVEKSNALMVGEASPNTMSFGGINIEADLIPQYTSPPLPNTMAAFQEHVYVKRLVGGKCGPKHLISVSREMLLYYSPFLVQTYSMSD